MPGGLVLACDDNGIGLAAEDRERAFDRFYRASTSSEGAGLGLHICRFIMERTGGSVRLFSEGTGTGTTAEVVLPAA